MRTVYFPSKGNQFQSFNSKEACERYEKEQEELEKKWEENRKNFDPNLIRQELISEIEKCSTVPIGTIATCSYDALSIKGMVKACQDFVEKYKEYLGYY